MVKIAITIQDKVELILDKVDNDIQLTKEEEFFYYKEIRKIKNESWINFIMNGCDINENEKPTDPNMAYIV